jgi:protein-S-isoprenylcysteine O-methyltransferase Ste14
MRSRRIVLVPLAVLALWLVLIVLGSLVSVAFQIPQKLGFPLIIRLIGLVAILASSLLFCWLFTYRSPVDVLTSTYVTFLKMTKQLPLEERSSRTEPLVVEGPYKYVRHPLYSCVVLLVFGLWLLLDYSPLLVTTILFLLWFNFVVAPFEERELKAIFGQKYDEYAKQVPRIIPIRRHANT